MSDESQKYLMAAHSEIMANGSIVEAMRVVSKIGSRKITPIRTDDESIEYTQMLVQAKGILRTVDTVRKTAVDPFNRTVKAINDWFKSNFTDPISGKEREVNQAVVVWRNKKAEEARKAQEAAEKLQAKLQKSAEKQGIDIPIPQIVLPKSETNVKVEGGSVHERKDLEITVTDIKALCGAIASGAVGENVVSVNLGVLKNLVKTGIDVPGVQSKWVKSLVVK
jgi:hypothetical protein